MQYSFIKMQGCGNDFVVFSDLDQPLPLTPEIIRHIANRRLGIGCDQILLVTQPLSNNTDFGYRIFNADGTEVSQCGNGARCLAHFIHHQQLSDKKTISLSTQTTNMNVSQIDNHCYQVQMPKPNFNPANLSMMNSSAPPYTLTLNEKNWSFFIADVGNPHMMILQNKGDDLPDENICKALSEHPSFPGGINISFAYLEKPSVMKLNVYERGAGWTHACGSAATACACILMHFLNSSNTMTIEQPGGALTVDWTNTSGPVLSGPSEICFKGNIIL